MTILDEIMTIRGGLMLMLFKLVSTALMVFGFWIVPAGADPALEHSGEAALHWLSLVDSDAYGPSWDAAGSQLRHEIERRDWVHALSRGRDALGSLISRVPGRGKIEHDPDGAPQGVYAFWEYRAEYPRQSVTELVVLRLDENENWRVVGYVLH